jgi:glutamate carboxypeptidase
MWAQLHTPDALPVEINSPTENLGGVKRVGALFKPEFDKLLFKTRWIDMPPAMKRAGHLFAEHEGTHGKRILLIGHLDTVLPGGTYKKEGLKITGSGVYDMKGGDVIMLYALKALDSIGALEGTRIIAAFSGDEEAAGEPLEISRKDLLEAAHRSDVALAFENAIGDAATIARRSSSSWRLEVTGVSGHSSAVWGPVLGDGAIYEAARIVDEFRLQLKKVDGLTCNVAVMVGGSDATFEGGRGTAAGKLNVVPNSAYVRGDLRALTAAQLEQVRATMREICSHSLRRTSAKITFQDTYPAMEATPASLDLLKQLSQASQDLGYAAVGAMDPKDRGAGDISFVAPIIPSLDGLGARGGGAHAKTEYADAASFPELVKRTAILLYRLTR